MEEKWMEGVTMDMLPEAHRKYAEVIGVEATLKLCATWGGGKPYVPVLDRVYAIMRDEIIRKEFAQGKGVPALARKYGLTERMIQLIVEENRPEQTNLFDGL